MCVTQKKDGKGEEQVNDTRRLDHFSATTIWIEKSMLERGVERSMSPGIMDLISLPWCSLEHVCQKYRNVDLYAACSSRSRSPWVVFCSLLTINPDFESECL